MGRGGWLLAALVVGGLALLLVGGGGMGDLSEGQLGSLVYLVVLLALVGTFARGVVFAGASRTARNALAWVGILVVLLGGYAYRDELQDVGHRVTLGLVPGSAVTRLADDGTTRVQVGRDRFGHFSVEGLVDGVPVRFLVDTGASTVALSARDARRVGLEPETLRYDQPILTANGRAFAAAVTLDAVSVGGIERRGLEASVSPPGALSQSLLGMSFVGSLASFEIRGDRLILAD